MKSVTDYKKFRTKEMICTQYLDFLLEMDLIKRDEYRVYKEQKINEVMELLLLKLYETETINGQEVSSLDAFYHFCRFVIDRDPYTGRTVWNDFVKNLFIDIEHHKLTSILATRGGGKSFMIFGLYVPFKHFLWEFHETIIISNIPRMCKRNMRILKSIIDNNELLLDKKETWKGEKNLVWSQDEIEYNKGMISTSSLGSTPRSAHVNLVVLDDPLRDDNKYSYEDIENYVFGQLMPVIGRKNGRMVLQGTPMTYRDIFHATMKDEKGNLIRDGRYSTKGFFSRAYPAILNESERIVLLPDIYPYEKLMEIRKTQGERYFDREYMLICQKEDTAIFSYALIESCTDTKEKIKFSGDEEKQYVIGVDVATSGAASADYSAYIVLELRSRKVSGEYADEKVIRHIYHEKGVDVADQIDKVEELSRLFNGAFVLVEKNNVGVDLIQQLAKRNVNVGEMTTDKFKKEAMVRFVVDDMRRRRLVFPDETPEIKRLRNELRNFGVKERGGKERMESLSGHDDLVMALCLAEKASQEVGGEKGFAVCQD